MKIFFINFIIIFVILLIVNFDNILTLNEEGREQALYWHNYYRSQIAQGKSKNYTNKESGYMPKAKKMKQMNYSLELEKNAQEWSNKCSCEHSGISGESFYCFPQNLNDSYAIMQAIIGWNAELEARGALGPISKYGNTCIPFDGNFERGIGHWMQIVWSETTQVGCAVTHCYSYTNVFCQYRPAGNVQRGCIYWEGIPCSECKDNCNKSNSLCLI